MAYYPPMQTMQPYPYQDQLNQLRNNPMQMPGQGYPVQMPMQARPDPTGLNWVQGEAGAKSWFVAPGATVLLMDSENQRFYLKSADMNGMPAMKTYEYVEVGAQKPVEAQPVADFVTVEVFERFRNDVLKRLDDLSEPVEVSVSRKGKKGANADE